MRANLNAKVNQNFQVTLNRKSQHFVDTVNLYICMFISEFKISRINPAIRSFGQRDPTSKRIPGILWIT